MSLYTDLNSFVVTLGAGAPGWNDCYLSDGEVTDLATYVGPDFLPLAERWYSELKVSGGNPYNAISDSKLGPLALRDTLKSWAGGTTYDPTSKQIQILLAQKAAAEKDIAAGTPRQDTNLDAILQKLHALGWSEPPTSTTALPGDPAHSALMDKVLRTVAEKVLGVKSVNLNDLAVKLGAVLPSGPR